MQNKQREKNRIYNLQMDFNTLYGIKKEASVFTDTSCL